MTKRYPIPAGESHIELQIKNSRFIGRAAYTPTVEEAKTFIDQIKTEHPEASHVVYAFAVGYGASVIHGMSDAGEPSGTAGRPTLAVVKGCDLGDVTVVSVRYFGGTKLGTGGLVKAYTETAQIALEELPVTEKVARQTVEVVVPYPFYEALKQLVEAYNGQVDSQTFTVEVTAELTLAVDDMPAFEAALIEVTAGQAKFAYN